MLCPTNKNNSMLKHTDGRWYYFNRCPIIITTTQLSGVSKTALIRINIISLSSDDESYALLYIIRFSTLFFISILFFFKP